MPKELYSKRNWGTEDFLIMHVTKRAIKQKKNYYFYKEVHSEHSLL